MAREIEYLRHSSDLGSWESAVAAPHAALRQVVREYVGGSEATHQPLVRRELPSEIAPVIINFGAPFRMFNPDRPDQHGEFRSFATGAFDRFALVGSTGAYTCVQINFTVLGARLFLQRPLGDLFNREAGLDVVLGRDADELEQRLFDAPSWAARFDILDRVILDRLRVGPRVPDAVEYAWRALVHTRGQASIGRIAYGCGASHKHLITQFTEQFGLTPKAMARVLRFGRAAELLKTSPRGRLADIAQTCGYYDQAHFTRDFRAFAGVTPTELLASQLPNRGGFVG
jgi:AraC-like DNA-binding protein